MRGARPRKRMDGRMAINDNFYTVFIAGENLCDFILVGRYVWVAGQREESAWTLRYGADLLHQEVIYTIEDNQLPVA